MKANMKEQIKGFSGKLDGMIYYYHPRLKKTLMRKAPKMPHQQMNEDYTVISRQIKALTPSDAYKYDFKGYLNELKNHDETANYPSWYAVFTSMLWKMKAKYPDTVDLKTITRDQIEAENLPCRSVKAAVEDGLLKPVPGWELLNKLI
jgi:hypothetical protein